MMTNYKIPIEKPRHREFHLETFQSRDLGQVTAKVESQETNDAKSLD
jgi:hypothetical protein